MDELENEAVCGPDGCAVPAVAPPKAVAAPGPQTVLDISIVSDVICPWCYVGKKRLEKALLMLPPTVNARLTWRPFELNPDMPKEGVDRSLYRIRKFGSLGRSEEKDAELRLAAAPDGIVFRHDLMRRTPNTFAAHRLLWRAAQAGVQNELAEILFRAYFTQGRDVGDIATLAGLAAEAGMDYASSLAFLQGEEGAKEVRAEQAIAHRAGITGVPTFIANGYLLFAGAQKPAVMADVLKKVAALPAPEAAG